MKKEDMQKILNHKYKMYEECLYAQKRYFQKEFEQIQINDAQIQENKLIKYCPNDEKIKEC